MDVGSGSNNIAIRHEGLVDEDIGLGISGKWTVSCVKSLEI
jgi:hypothetical protein